jgi:hypothetical protein
MYRHKVQTTLPENILFGPFRAIVEGRPRLARVIRLSQYRPGRSASDTSKILLGTRRCLRCSLCCRDPEESEGCVDRLMSGTGASHAFVFARLAMPAGLRLSAEPHQCDPNESGNQKFEGVRLRHGCDLKAVEIGYKSPSMIVSWYDDPREAVGRKLASVVCVRNQNIWRPKIWIKFGKRQEHFVSVGSGGHHVLVQDVGIVSR